MVVKVEEAEALLEQLTEELMGLCGEHREVVVIQERGHKHRVETEE
jgi:hypothetical protein